MANIFKISNLSFEYKKNNPILKNINVEIERGKITTLLGENGCGKSTLLNILAKNLKYNSGEVFYNDKSLKNYSLKNFAREVSMVHQKNTLVEDITVYDMVSFGRLPYQNIIFKFSIHYF